MTKDFDTSRLTGLPRAIADKIVAFLRGRLGDNFSGGGCRAFYSPEEWIARGEKYGRDSALILVHDGGCLAPFCNWDYCDYKSIDAMTKFLDKHGCYAENCTSWYSAVYVSDETLAMAGEMAASADGLRSLESCVEHIVAKG